MRNALLYLLLFSYSTIVLKPVFPTIADTVAHIFWYSEHMATVHFENGKYHVHLEYQQAAKNTPAGKDAALLKAFPDSDHIINYFSYCFETPVLITGVSLHPSSLFLSAIPDRNYPPPRS